MCWKTLIKEKSERIEIYNYKNKEDFENFRRLTETNEELNTCFDDTNEDLNVSAERWLSV